LGADYPDWLDAEWLKSATAIGILVACLLILFVFVFVRSLAAKVLLVTVLGACAFGLFVWRDEVKDCAPSCDCSFMGEHIPSDGCNIFTANDT
jgi:hypothetical protein